MKTKIATLLFTLFFFCNGISAANWVTVTTAKGNVFHFDTEMFTDFSAMMNYVWTTANQLDERYGDGSYNR